MSFPKYLSFGSISTNAYLLFGFFEDNSRAASSLSSRTALINFLEERLCVFSILIVCSYVFIFSAVKKFILFSKLGKEF